LDVIAIVRKTAEPFERRSLEWDLISLPVPAEIIVYSLPEWEKLEQGNTRFFRMLDRHVVWTFSMHPPPPNNTHLSAILQQDRAVHFK
jgi:hypothetical protein